MKRSVQLSILTVLALGAGFVALLMGTGTPVSAVPDQLNFSFVHVVQRSSTRAAVYAEQRGSAPVLELAGTAAVNDIKSDAPVRIDKLVIVPYGTNAGLVTMTPTLTSTPTPTRTLTPTP